MPAPKFLSGMPKPVLFGLYGAVGGLLGALVFGEPLYRLLTPPPPPPAGPQAQVAVAASKDVEVFVDDENTFPVQVARDGFTGPVTVRVDGLPAGVTAAPIRIPPGESEGKVVVVGTPAAAVGPKQARVLAEVDHDGKSITAEVPINFKVTNPPRPLADVVFVLDVTNTMQWAIEDLQVGIGQFAGALGKARVNFRLGLVTFQDITNPGEKVTVVQFGGGPFTANPAAFRDTVAGLKAAGGGDIPESSLEALAEASKLPFRKGQSAQHGVTKILLLITDAPPKVVKGGTDEAVRDAAKTVRAAEIDSVHVVGQRFDADVYRPITAAGRLPGKWFDLRDVVVGDEGFDGLLTALGGAVTAAATAMHPDSKPQVAARAEKPTLGVKSLQSGEQSAAGTEGRLVLRSGAWTAAIAGLVCLALLAGQHHYLRGQLPAAGGVAAGFLGGLAVGLVGGAAGQGLYFLAPDSAVLATAFRVFGWALLGGLAGVGLSLFIPNMRWSLGLAGGAVGGAAGAVGFIAVSAVTGDLVGRLVGGLVLGFCIGLMVAVAEAAFRRAWLEVRFGARETITVTLGPEPVKIGGDSKACTVWARGAAAVALRFFVRDAQVICDDAVVRRESAVADGFTKEVGNVTVTVRTGTNTTPSAPPKPTPRPAPAAAVAQKSPAPMSLDEDDGFDLPMPVASSPAPPPAPAKSKPVVEVEVEAASPPASEPEAVAEVEPPAPPPPPPRPKAPAAPPKPAPPRPVPAGSKPSSPSVPPAAPKPAGPKHPDGCPSCGRVNAGKPKQRYCMVCDETY